MNTAKIKFCAILSYFVPDIKLFPLICSYLKVKSKPKMNSILCENVLLALVKCENPMDKSITDEYPYIKCDGTYNCDICGQISSTELPGNIPFGILSCNMSMVAIFCFKCNDMMVRKAVRIIEITGNDEYIKLYGKYKYIISACNNVKDVSTYILTLICELYMKEYKGYRNRFCWIR